MWNFKKTIMSVTLVEKEKFLQELKKMEYGEKATLKSNLKNLGLSEEVIEDAYKEFNLVGVFSHGYDGLCKLRFSLTDFGKKYCDTFLSFNQIKQGLVAIKSEFNVQ